jgi:hypothetical protein
MLVSSKVLIGQISLVGSWVWCNKCLCFKFGASTSEQQMQVLGASNFFGNGAGYEANKHLFKFHWS